MIHVCVLFFLTHALSADVHVRDGTHVVQLWAPRSVDLSAAAPFLKPPEVGPPPSARSIPRATPSSSAPSPRGPKRDVTSPTHARQQVSPPLLPRSGSQDFDSAQSDADPESVTEHVFEPPWGRLDSLADGTLPSAEFTEVLAYLPPRHVLRPIEAVHGDRITSALGDGTVVGVSVRWFPADDGPKGMAQRAVARLSKHGPQAKLKSPKTCLQQHWEWHESGLGEQVVMYCVMFDWMLRPAMKGAASSPPAAPRPKEATSSSTTTSSATSPSNKGQPPPAASGQASPVVHTKQGSSLWGWASVFRAGRRGSGDSTASGSVARDGTLSCTARHFAVGRAAGVSACLLAVPARVRHVHAQPQPEPGQLRPRHSRGWSPPSRTVHGHQRRCRGRCSHAATAPTCSVGADCTAKAHGAQGGLDVARAW